MERKRVLELALESLNRKKAGIDEEIETLRNKLETAPEPLSVKHHLSHQLEPEEEEHELLLNGKPKRKGCERFGLLGEPRQQNRRLQAEKRDQ